MIEKQYPVLHDIEKLKQGSEKDEDWFWETAQELNNIAASFGLAYIYCIERINIGYVFRISSVISRDHHPEWLGGLVWNESEEHPEEVDRAYDTQKMTLSSYPFVDEWGSLVSVYLPIVTNGKTVGLLGVDFDISYINSLENRILLVLLISFAISAAFTGVLAYIGSRSVIVTIEEREKITHEAVERQMEIEKLMNALKKSSEARNAFLSSISSSMADPINHIIKISSQLSKYTEIKEDHQKNLEVINDEGMKLFDVINDILDILKIEAGKLKFNPVKYKLPKLISEVTSTYLVYTESKPVQYKLVIDDKLPVNLAGDELRIKQIFHYLLTNAFKYTNTGGITVNITSKLKNEYLLLVIKIADTGVGMTEEKLNSIFENYGQGSGGLGLFLCKQLAEIMKGTLSVTSEIGKGSVFTLCIPQKLLSNETIGPDTAKRLAAFRM
jgi:signal transduction histidine kinase